MVVLVMHAHSALEHQPSASEGAYEFSETPEGTASAPKQIELPLPLFLGRAATLYQTSRPDELVADLKSPRVSSFGVGLALIGSLLLGTAFTIPATQVMADSAFVLGITAVTLGAALLSSFLQLNFDREHNILRAIFGIAVPFQIHEVELAGFSEVHLRKEVRYLNRYGFFNYVVTLFNPDSDTCLEIDRRESFIEARKFAVMVAEFLDIQYVEVITGIEHRGTEKFVTDPEPVRTGQCAPRAAFYPEGGALVVELAAPTALSANRLALRHTLWCMVMAPLVVCVVMGCLQVFSVQMLPVLPVETALLALAALGAIGSIGLLHHHCRGRRRERLLVSHDRLRIEQSYFLSTHVVELSAADIIEILLPDQYLHPALSSPLDLASLVSSGILVRSQQGSLTFGTGQSLDELIYIYNVVKRTLVV